MEIQDKIKRKLIKNGLKVSLIFNPNEFKHYNIPCIINEKGQIKPINK